MEEILEFCFKKFAAVWLFRNFLFSVLPVILLIPSKGTVGLSAVGIPVFFFAVFAAVDFLLFIGQEEEGVEFLLDGSNAARIPVDCDIVIDEAEDVEIQRFDRAFHL